VQLLVAGDATTAGASVSIRRRYAYQGLRLGAIATEGHSEPFLPSDPSKCKSMASNTSHQEAPFSPLFSPLRARIPVLSGVAARRRPNLKVVAEPAEPRATVPSRRREEPRCCRAVAALLGGRRCAPLGLPTGLPWRLAAGPALPRAWLAGGRGAWPPS
jgi:hypothetical protein